MIFPYRPIVLKNSALSDCPPMDCCKSPFACSYAKPELERSAKIKVSISNAHFSAVKTMAEFSTVSARSGHSKLSVSLEAIQSARAY